MDEIVPLTRERIATISASRPESLCQAQQLISKALEVARDARNLEANAESDTTFAAASEPTQQQRTIKVTTPPHTHDHPTRPRAHYTRLSPRPLTHAPAHAHYTLPPPTPATHCLPTTTTHAHQRCIQWMRKGSWVIAQSNPGVPSNSGMKRPCIRGQLSEARPASRPATQAPSRS